MKKIFTLFVFLLFIQHHSFSQCTEQSKNKVLLLGDSWGYFMNFEGTINQQLKKWGFSGYKYVTTGNLVVNGADTWDFLEAARQQEIITQFNQNPDIKVVHLSIGGNDFLGDWKKSMTQGAVDTMKAAVMDRLDSIIRFLKIAKPGVHIVWSGYCYTNFEEPITAPGLFQGSNHPFYGTWEGMEFPSFLQINTLLNEVSQDMITHIAGDPQLHFVPETGILQYTTGQTSPICCNIQPQGTYQPHTVSLPWGDVNYPSPMSTMRDYIGLAKDCFHLSPQGYSDFIGYQMQKFYQKFFMDDLYLLSEPVQTGSVSSTGNVSDTLFLGGNANAEFATVLSFNTTTMADTGVAKASLFLRRKASSGTNPITANLQVKVKNGNFGATASIEAADFTATADASGTACLFGSNDGNDSWIRLDLPAALLPYINHNAATQFIISAPGVTNGLGYFYDSSDPEFAPVLNLVYSNPLNVEEVREETFSVYPNPTSNSITIKNNGAPVKLVTITDLLGKKMLETIPTAGNTVDVSSLAAGMYMISITTPNGTLSKRIVKN